MTRGAYGATWGAYGAQDPSDGSIRRHPVSENDNQCNSRSRRSRSAFDPAHEVAPPAGFEPALTAPEAVALSPELWGLRDTKGYQPHALRGHAQPGCARTRRKTLPSPG